MLTVVLETVVNVVDVAVVAVVVEEVDVDVLVGVEVEVEVSAGQLLQSTGHFSFNASPLTEFSQ